MLGIHIQARRTAESPPRYRRILDPSRIGLWFAIATLGLAFSTRVCEGQDIVVSTPLNRISDSYYEAIGVNFGFQFRGPNSQVFFNQGSTSTTTPFTQGSAASAIPQFGGFDPNTAARFGYNVINSNGSGYSLGFEMGKGSSRSMVGQSPSVVVPNGGTGSIFDGSLRPFVTAVIPIVGNPGDIVEPYVPPYQPPQSLGSRWSDLLSPERESRPRTSSSSSISVSRNENSSAQHGDLSVAELKAERAVKESEAQSQLDALIAQAEAYEKDGDYLRARSSYRKAVKRAEGRQRYDLQLKLESLLGK